MLVNHTISSYTRKNQCIVRLTYSINILLHIYERTNTYKEDVQSMLDKISKNVKL